MASIKLFEPWNQLSEEVAKNPAKYWKSFWRLLAMFSITLSSIGIIVLLFLAGLNLV